MVRLNWWESMVACMIQTILYMGYPWETSSRADVVLLLVVLGVCAVAILGMAEWTLEHIFKMKIPG